MGLTPFLSSLLFGVKPSDPLTTFYICNRPVFVASPPGSTISLNLAGRLAADFAHSLLCTRLPPASANVHIWTLNPCVESGLEGMRAALDAMATALPSPPVEKHRHLRAICAKWGAAKYGRA